MNTLLDYLKNEDEIILIKNCMFHYEMEFIHPFADGNGRMGRPWQSVILIGEYPIFQFLPFETLIAAKQDEYYNLLSQCDKAGNSTLFIEYMSKMIDQELTNVLSKSKAINLSQNDRFQYFLPIANSPFSRNDYMKVFKNLSSASASRDLKKGIDLELFSKSGDKRLTIYHVGGKE